MGEHIHYAVGISLFFVFFTMTVVGGGFEDYVGNETLNEHNVSQEDLEVSPDIPDASSVSVDIIEDIDQKNNTKVYNVSNLTDPDFQTEEAIGVDNSSYPAYIYYQVPEEVSVVETKSTEQGFFEAGQLQIAQYATTSVNDFSGDAISTLYLQGESDITLDSDTNYIGFKIDSGSDFKLYDLNYKDEVEQGFFGSIVAWFVSAGKSIASWFAIIGGLPPSLVWIGIALGMIALIVVIMMITW